MSLNNTSFHVDPFIGMKTIKHVSLYVFMGAMIGWERRRIAVYGIRIQNVDDGMNDGSNTKEFSELLVLNKWDQGVKLSSDLNHDVSC